MAGTKFLPREIKYAEDVLKFTERMEDVSQRNDAVAIWLHRKAQMEQIIRDARKAIADREEAITLQVVEDVTGAPEGAKTSVAALERLTKQAIMVDETLVAAKQKLVNHENEMSDIEAGYREAELGHRAAITQLRAVSEYMAYLRSARDARTLADTQLPY